MIRNFVCLKYQSRKAYKRCGVRNLVKSIDEPVRSRRSADSDLLEIESLFSENINVEERQARAADTRVCLRDFFFFNNLPQFRLFYIIFQN